MSAIQRQPTDLNFLSPLGFKFYIHKTPNIDWMVQAVNIPSISIGMASQPNPFVNIPRPGDHLQFGPMSIVFKIDEKMLNYLELYNWFIGMGFPDNFEQSKVLYAQTTYEQKIKNTSGKGAFSDATLTILDSAMNSIGVVSFYDIFPTSISELTFDSRNATVNYLEATCTFAYRKFSLESAGNLTTF